MVGDLSQPGTEIELRVEAVELGRADARVAEGRSLTARVRTGKQVILTSRGYTTRGPFGAVVVDLQKAIVEIACRGARQ